MPKVWSLPGPCTPPPPLQFPPPFSHREVNLTTTKKYVQNPDVPCTEPQRGEKNYSLEEFYFSCAFLLTLVRARPEGARLWDPVQCTGASWAVNAASRPSPGSLPHVLLQSSSLLGFGVSLFDVPSCPSSFLPPSSWMSSRASIGDSFCVQVWVASCGQPYGSPQTTHLLLPHHSCLAPVLCALRPLPGCRPPPVVTCSLSSGPGAAAQRPGQQRAPLVQKCATDRVGRGRLGEEPCRCILFSKKIKYFHGKLSLCVFLPHLLLFLSPELSSRVSSLSPSPGDPTPQPGLWLWVWPAWGPGHVEAGTPLHAICAAFASPSRAQGGSEDGCLAAGPR